MGTTPTRILFVCLGNICRSPLAEGIFRHLAQREGVAELFEVDSAGTSSFHVGDPPDRRSAATARDRGVELEGRSRQFTASDLAKFDYVIAMDSDNLAEIRNLEIQSGGRAKAHLLREWDPAAPGTGVPDPYYGGDRGFEDVHDIVQRACENLLADLLRRSAER